MMLETHTAVTVEVPEDTADIVEQAGELIFIGIAKRVKSVRSEIFVFIVLKKLECQFFQKRLVLFYIFVGVLRSNLYYFVSVLLAPCDFFKQLQIPTVCYQFFESQHLLIYMHIFTKTTLIQLNFKRETLLDIDSNALGTVRINFKNFQVEVISNKGLAMLNFN